MPPCTPYVDPGTTGHVLVCTTATLPTGGELYAGRVVYNITTGCLHYYDGTNWWQLNDEIICTSATRPTGAALHDGLRIFETDTKEHLVYYSAAAVWRRPWNSPWGVIDNVTVSSDQTGITSEVDVTSATSTKTYVANRLIRISYQLAVYSTTAGNIPGIKVFKDGSSFETHQGPGFGPAAGTSAYSTVGGAWVTDSPTAGSHTYKLRIYRMLGSGEVNIQGTVSKTRLLIEDIGPSNTTTPA